MEVGWFILNNEKLQKTIFLDRDGVVNQCAKPHCYITKWEDFHFMPRVAEGIKILNDLGYLVLIVTNQRGISRGICTVSEIEVIHQHMCEELARDGARIDGIYVCPHDRYECDCRKPLPGLFYQAKAEWLIDKKQSYCIGDSKTDIQAGHNYGIQAILIGKAEQKYGQELTFGSLLDASIYLKEMEANKK